MMRKISPAFLGAVIGVAPTLTATQPALWSERSQAFGARFEKITLKNQTKIDGALGSARNATDQDKRECTSMQNYRSTVQWTRV
jgi:hypothetical protein